MAGFRPKKVGKCKNCFSDVGFSQGRDKILVHTRHGKVTCNGQANGKTVAQLREK